MANKRKNLILKAQLLEDFDKLTSAVTLLKGVSISQMSLFFLRNIPQKSLIGKLSSTTVISVLPSLD